MRERVAFRAVTSDKPRCAEEPVAAARRRFCGRRKEDRRGIAKVIEMTSESTKSMDDAIRRGIEDAGKTVRLINGAWVKEQKVFVKDGKIEGFRVDMKVTFVVD
jgi:flavin-binding protein dodecin